MRRQGGRGREGGRGSEEAGREKEWEKRGINNNDGEIFNNSLQTQICSLTWIWLKEFLSLRHDTINGTHSAVCLLLII